MQNLWIDIKNWTLYNWPRSESQCTSSMQTNRNRKHNRVALANMSKNWLRLTLLATLLCLIQFANHVDADEATKVVSTTPLTPDLSTESMTVTGTEKVTGMETTTSSPAAEDWQPIVNATRAPEKQTRKQFNGSGSLLLRFARSFSSGNELWDGIIRDCYKRPDMSCFQKNVYTYLDGALNMEDVNVTQRLKFYKNQVQYEPENEIEETPNEARSGKFSFNFNS